MITLTPSEIADWKAGKSENYIITGHKEAPAQRQRQRRGKREGAPTERGRGGLQRAAEAILERLRISGAILDWWHSEDRAKRERPGIPDLVIAVREGLVIAIELKSATGHTTQEQERWLAAWGERGSLCRSVGEVLDFLKKHQVIG